MMPIIKKFVTFIYLILKLVYSQSKIISVAYNCPIVIESGFDDVINQTPALVLRPYANDRKRISFVRLE